MYEFKTPGPITFSVHLGAGAATVMAEERDNAVVSVEPADGSDASRQQAENTHVELRGNVLVVKAPEGGWIWRRGSVLVTARVPVDSSFDVHVASADVTVGGRWSEGSVTSASGRVDVEDVTGDLRLKTASGNLRVGAVGGDLRATSASADLDVGSVGGDAVLHSASGDVRVHDTGGSAQARTASGDIDLLRVRRGELRAQTASGNVDITVLAGTGVYLDVRTLSGTTSSDLDVSDAPAAGAGPKSTLSVRVHTASGNVSVMRATPVDGDYTKTA